MALYREDLDASRCDALGCEETLRTGELYLHPRCHVDSPTWVCYRGGVLTIECARCDRVVATIVVASRGHDRPPPEEDDERCP